MKPHITCLLFSASIAGPAMAQPPIYPVACYALNGDAQDASGGDHHGTVVGAIPTVDRYGTPDRAYAFDGVTDHILIPDFGALGITGEVTIGVWVRANVASGNFAVSIWPDNFYDRLAAAPYYGHNGGCTIFWDFGNAASGGRLSVIPYAFSAQWEHFTFTSSAANNRMRVYRNGTLVAALAQHSTITNTERSLTIGGGDVAGYSHWDGDLDEVVLYDRELDEADVADLYTFGAPCHSVVGMAEEHAAEARMAIDRMGQQLAMDLKEGALFQVFDATGRVAAQERFGAGRHTWNWSGMPAGTYIASVVHGSGRTVRKFVVE